MVEYKEFCREIESAFGNHEVEKNPLINKLLPDDEDLVAKGLSAIAERVT